LEIRALDQKSQNRVKQRKNEQKKTRKNRVSLKGKCLAVFPKFQLKNSCQKWSKNL
jgi:hypothetical protein